MEAEFNNFGTPKMSLPLDGQFLHVSVWCSRIIAQDDGHTSSQLQGLSDMKSPFCFVTSKVVRRKEATGHGLCLIYLCLLEASFSSYICRAKLRNGCFSRADEVLIRMDPTLSKVAATPGRFTSYLQGLPKFSRKLILTATICESVSLSPLTWARKHPISETLCFLVFRSPDDGQSPEIQQFWVLYTIVRLLQESNLKILNVNG
jgi:hypothetical protein